MKIIGFLSVALGVFLAFWALGFWMNPEITAWARRLPLGLGMPVFVLGGLTVALSALAAPILAFIWLAGGGK